MGLIMARNDKSLLRAGQYWDANVCPSWHSVNMGHANFLFDVSVYWELNIYDGPDAGSFIEHSIKFQSFQDWLLETYGFTFTHERGRNVLIKTIVDKEKYTMFKLEWG